MADLTYRALRDFDDDDTAKVCTRVIAFWELAGSSEPDQEMQTSLAADVFAIRQQLLAQGRSDDEAIFGRAVRAVAKTWDSDMIV